MVMQCYHIFINIFFSHDFLMSSNVSPARVQLTGFIWQNICCESLCFPGSCAVSCPQSEQCDLISLLSGVVCGL